MRYFSATQFGTLRAKIPCWPNPSRLTLLLTRDLYRLIYGYAYIGLLLLFVFMFVFHEQVDSVLWLFGYNADFVSYFPFFRVLFFRLNESVWPGHVSVTYFHVLDLSLWLSLATWGTRLAAGLIFLKQYDDLYRSFSIRLAETPRGRVRGTWIATILLFPAPFFITYALMQPKILNDPEFVFLTTRLPTAYFLGLSVVYFFFASGIVEISLFLFWKVLRQKRRGVVLWQ
jgi:hypothetical protein